MDGLETTETVFVVTVAAVFERLIVIVSDVVRDNVGDVSVADIEHVIVGLRVGSPSSVSDHFSDIVGVAPFVRVRCLKGDGVDGVMGTPGTGVTGAGV